MTKVVINTCYGGFGLSPEALSLYLSKQGKKAFHYVNARSPNGGINFQNWVRMGNEKERHFSFVTVSQDLGENPTVESLFDESVYFPDRDIKRDDPNLVAVVEELGDKANGDYAELSVVEIPDDVKWEIEKYDGVEWVAEAHRVWR